MNGYKTRYTFYSFLICMYLSALLALHGTHLPFAKVLMLVFLFIRHSIDFRPVQLDWIRLLSMFCCYSIKGGNNNNFFLAGYNNRVLCYVESFSTWNATGAYGPRFLSHFVSFDCISFLRLRHDMFGYQVVFVQLPVFVHRISNEKCSYAYSFLTKSFRLSLFTDVGVFFHYIKQFFRFFLFCIANRCNGQTIGCTHAHVKRMQKEESAWEMD